MNENVNVCITPKGDKPVLHFSQFDNERVFTVTVLADDGESAVDLTDLDIEFRLRKTDSHVVTIAPISVVSNVITFLTTEQLCACCGQNIATVTLMKDDMVISTLDILVDIQRDILSGGLTSESDIRNLTTQIEQIVPEVIGDDYYNKQEVDELLAEHTFDPSNYYNKSDVDGLLSDKADSDNVYTKTETDNLLADKADSDDVYTKDEADTLLSAKMDSIGYNGIVDDISIISFNTDCIAPLDIIKGKIDPDPNGVSTLTIRRTGVNLWDEQWELGGIGPDGAELPNVDRIRSKNLIPVKPGISVFISYSDSRTVNFYVCEYDITGTFIQRTVTNKNTVFTVSNNCYFIRFFVYSATNPVTTYGNDISINYPASDTGYHAYNSESITISLGQSVTIGGVVDLTNGKITLTDTTEITITPVTVKSAAGGNNVFIDTGNMTQIAYFEGVEDNLLTLIKACMI